MTWLKGTSTWANIVDDITKLVCGEMADGSAVTCDAADQWVREVGGQNHIRTHASADISLPNMSNRQGYFTNSAYVGSSSAVQGGTETWPLSVCRQTVIWSGVPTGVTNNKWVLAIAITTPNSVASNYSTLRFTYWLYDLDTATQLFTATAQAPNAAGVSALTIGTKTISIEFSDPSGIISAGQWWRSFTSVYVGGVDWWGPFYPRRAGAHSFSVTPPGGVITTDWVVDNIGADGGAFLTGFAQIAVPLGGGLTGLGIKTNTGLSGQKYTVSWNIAFNKIRLTAMSGLLNGQIGIEFFGGFADNGSGTYRQCSGNALLSSGFTWLRPYQTPASVTSGSAIQYWISVTAKKIVIVLNADPGQSGKLTCGMVGEFEPIDDTIDINPAFINFGWVDYVTTDASTDHLFYVQMTYWGWSLRQDGSEIRDWQTGYMRGDFANATSGNDPNSEGRANIKGYSSLVRLYQKGLTGAIDASTFVERRPVVPGAQVKPSFADGKWWLYGTTLAEGYIFNTANFAQNSIEFYDRGYMDGDDCPVFFIPGIGWNSGDKLTDDDTSKEYFLIAGDYHGIYPRIRYASNVWTGGIAILEE